MASPDEPQRTADGRWIIVGGRRWRAADPAIPAGLRAELVSELMAARRAVAAARSPERERSARARVQDAKVALGERGEPWWEPATAGGLADRLAAAIRALTSHRGPERTICPSDAARVAGGARWRAAMGTARAVARRLAGDGVVELRQRGVALSPGASWRGPVRIARRGSDDR